MGPPTGCGYNAAVDKFRDSEYPMLRGLCATDIEAPADHFDN